MATLMKKNHSRSGPAIWYLARADLRGRRLQTGSVVLVVALATVLIGLALAVFGSVQAPYDRLFTQLNGAHLWVYYPAAPTRGSLMRSSMRPMSQQALNWKRQSVTPLFCWRHKNLTYISSPSPHKSQPLGNCSSPMVMDWRAAIPKVWSSASRSPMPNMCR